MKLLLSCLLILWSSLALAQHKSIRQLELEQHPLDTYTILPAPKHTTPVKSNCTLNKTVFGWHPYWMNGAEANYNWELLSDLCFFAYEVDAATGNATSTHGFASNSAVDSALAHGTNVHLCATLFSNHATFFGSTAAQDTLISKLISLIQARGAIGINIDFEGVPASQSANLTTFMTNLGNTLHSVNPAYQLSICLYAVDWSDVFNEAVLTNSVDFFTIMGYDYYWSGSSQAGPIDPLYGFSSSYDYSLSRSISYYLNEGIPNAKLVLGLPYYGREWETSSSAIPANTTGNNIYSRTYDFVRTNTSGLYNNPSFDLRSESRAYIFQNTGTWRQCWISEAPELKQRYEAVIRQNLKGIGIWALGYDDGYTELWDAISEELTNCRTWPCSDTLYDEGGPLGSYYNNESVAYTISPPNATSIQVNFTQFETEAGFDTLWIYDGGSTSSPLIGYYEGTNSPGTFTTTQGELTLRFKSDGSTRAPGWTMIYNCISDNIPPTTQAYVTPSWLTQNDTCYFTDFDNLGISYRFWNASSLVNGNWKGSLTLGHVFEDFEEIADWNNISGIWNIGNGSVSQTDETASNTNLALPYSSDTSEAYLFEWQAKIGGTGSNRRAGMHFMCSDLNLPNRGDSYFVYLRVDSDVIQWYKVTNDVYNLVYTVNYPIEADSLYTVQVQYSKSSGNLRIFVNQQYVGSWTDNTPLQQSTGISLRSGNCTFDVNKVVVSNSRTSEHILLVGNSGHFFTCNPSPGQQAGQIVSTVFDISELNTVNTTLYNIDFTAPTLDIPIEEQPDMDTILNTSMVQYYQLNALDSNSNINIKYYWIEKALSGDTVIPLTSFTSNSLPIILNSPENDTLYRMGFIAKNGAGLSDTVYSDGFRYISNLSVPSVIQISPRIYPNPTQDQLHLELNGLHSYTLINSFGKILQEGTFENTMIIDLQRYSSGKYILVLENKQYPIIKL